MYNVPIPVGPIQRLSRSLYTADSNPNRQWRSRGQNGHAKLVYYHSKELKALLRV